MIKLNVIYLKKKKRFQLRFKKINIRTSSTFKGEHAEHARWPYVFMLKFGSSRRQWSLDDRNVFDWSYYLPTKLKIIIF